MKSNNLLLSKLWTSYEAIKFSTIGGRYVSAAMLNESLKSLSPKVDISVAGTSVEHRSIYTLKLGSGPFKILAWSQMHGNESTTTKALLDLLNAFKELPDNSILNDFLERCTLLCIPQLNPDGATAYTRFNANNVDLNRDAVQLSQPESKVLREVYSNFKPDLCLNLHDQRTIYNVLGSKESATVSFLSPAANETRQVTPSRQIAMQYIAGMKHTLDSVIPEQIGRYDDSFNINCVGDYFQSQGTPTILFEAGHYANDYAREVTRKFIYLSLLKVIEQATYSTHKNHTVQEYSNIPENSKQLYDIVLRNVTYNNECTDLALQYNEQLERQNIHFVPEVAQCGNLSGFFGHREHNGEGAIVKINNQNTFSEGLIVNSLKINGESFKLI